MTPIHLADFVRRVGQEQAAQKLGISQAAISKALRIGRHILVQTEPSGELRAFEFKSFPCGSSQRSSIPDRELILSLAGGLVEHLKGSVHLSSAQALSQ